LCNLELAVANDPNQPVQMRRQDREIRFANLNRSEICHAKPVSSQMTEYVLLSRTVITLGAPPAWVSATALVFDA
jgi:hypothetical protein